jgi:hypothetical protein
MILVIGIASSAAIYFTAREDVAASVGYDVVNGTAYPIAPRDSKKYRHDMEMYGGKAAMLADDFNRWFDSLWQGETLAFTTVAISVLVASGFFFVARATQQAAKFADERERKKE